MTWSYHRFYGRMKTCNVFNLARRRTRKIYLLRSFMNLNNGIGVHLDWPSDMLLFRMMWHLLFSWILKNEWSKNLRWQFNTKIINRILRMTYEFDFCLDQYFYFCLHNNRVIILNFDIIYDFEINVNTQTFC